VNKLIWAVREIIADLSTYYHLQPGDLIYTGTPEGVASVVRGDTLVGGVTGLGELHLKVA
jgi:fumarylpyruvate hydrolase